MSICGVRLLEVLDGASSELEQVIGVLGAAGHPDPTEMTMAEGDRALLALVDAVDGPRVEVRAVCPHCQAISEATLTPATVGVFAHRSRWLGPGDGVRAPRYTDLADLPSDLGAAVDALVDRCAIGTVDPVVVLEAIEEIDGSLAGPIGLCCVGCEAALEVETDVQHLALQSLRATAERVDREVHLLAATYGWDLSTITALPEVRRRRLASLIEAG